MIVLANEQEAGRISQEMLSEGVVVRPLRAFGLSNCLRISTGSDEDNRLCIEALRRSYVASPGAARAG